MDLQLSGKTLDGKYRVEAALGAGGMGAVFRATHVGTDRPVALKIIAPHLMNDADSLERFKREARAAGRLQHPNVVNVTDFGIVDVDQQNVAYLAMEYLEGFTLGELLRRQKKLPVSLAVDILEQVAVAVDEAHRLGIVHRDLKPENIWLRPDKRGGYEVKVLDFGVASFRETAIAEERPAKEHLTAMTTAVATPHLTRAGSVVGTPAYMSPEQCSGAAATPKSDIYSLGVIAYQMMTGELPFSGNTLELIAKHMAAPPPAVNGVPKRVAEVVTLALSKSPEERPVSATAFAGALRARSDGPTMIFRRAVALYSIRFDEVLRLSIAAYAPLLIWTAIVLPLLAIYGLRAAGAFFAGAFILMPGDVTSSWLVYILVDQLRQHPLEPISTEEVIRRFGEKTGATRPLTRSRLLLHSPRVFRIGWRVMRASFMKQVGRTPPGFLLFAYIDSGDTDRAVAMSRMLAKEVSWRARVAVYTFTLLVAGAMYVFLMLNFLEAFGLTPSVAGFISRAVLIIAALALAAFAVVITPLVTIAQAIFYFHARRAAGEDVSFSMAPRL